MSELKLTVTVSVEDTTETKRQSYRVGYCVGLAYASFPVDLQRHFEHFGVQILLHEAGRVSIRVTLLAWFRYQKSEAQHEQWEYFKRTVDINPRVDMFQSDEGNAGAIEWLKSKLLEVLRKHILDIEKQMQEAKEKLHEQLRMVVGVEAVS